MTWHKSTMLKAIGFAAGKTVADPQVRPQGAKFDWAVVSFADGTAVACRSVWFGPYSDVTPDIDVQDPEWWIYG